MVFLHSHGVGTARAVRIFKTYGADAIQVMTENPYRLARDIRGRPPGRRKRPACFWWVCIGRSAPSPSD